MMAAMTEDYRMTLKELLHDLAVVDYLPEVEVTGMTLDSRKVLPGYVFVALEGQYDHGLAYAEVAVEKGCVAVFCDADFDQYCQQILSRLMTRVMCVPVKNLQRKLGIIASRMYDYARDDIFITGITGTDGKTSVSHFIAQCMNSEKRPSAVVGTLGNGLLSQLSESSHTTPDVISLHEMLSDYYKAGAASIAMEVSSHGLDQNRVSGLVFDVAVLTNLSRDHLDYHGTVDAYKKAKLKLFADEQSKSLVLNIDDVFGDEIYGKYKDKKKIWLYGLDQDKARLSRNYAYADELSLEKTGISFTLYSSQGVARVSTRLIGEFNVYNALACFCVLIESGMNFNHAVKKLEKLETVKGRMEIHAIEGKPAFVIDYAHTPEALSQALMNIRKHTRGKLICVFGCGGDRDSGKRPLMAQVAEELSDLVIITSDNPRNESPENIIEDIKKGVVNHINVIIEQDREEAIKQALNMASEDDIVLIAGKGHEEYQLIAEQKIPFSDRRVALAALGESA